MCDDLYAIYYNHCFILIVIQMVFYVEACESGSMFENLLPQDINGKK